MDIATIISIFSIIISALTAIFTYRQAAKFKDIEREESSADFYITDQSIKKHESKYEAIIRINNRNNKPVGNYKYRATFF